MKNYKCYCFFCGMFRLFTWFCMGFVSWKLVRYWREGRAKNAGNIADTAIRTASAAVEKAASALEKWAENGIGEEWGKEIDNAVIEAQKVLNKAAETIQKAVQSRDLKGAQK